jgi:hypothetical protein
MKRSYVTPTVQCLGSIQVLTLTNNLNNISDVPIGDPGETAGNPSNPAS